MRWVKIRSLGLDRKKTSEITTESFILKNKVERVVQKCTTVKDRDLIDRRERCIKLFARIADKKQKFRLNQMEPDLFIARNVIGNTGLHEDS
jgi:hypothetical protein